MSNKTIKYTQYLIVAVVLIFVIRVILAAIFPFMDTTEARYADISRMVDETNNWIMPQYHYNVPFWGKPPLYAWLSAISFRLFGLSEFAGRLPSLILSLITILFVGKWALNKKGLDFWFFAFVLLITPEFLMHVGVLSTEVSLNLSIAIIMISFWKAINAPQKSIWGYLFFFGIGLGLMAKGPIALMLTAPPIFIWCVFQKNWKQLWQRIPWLVGFLIASAIAVPWYVIANIKSPGFLDYFIIGEHFKRFVDPGWEGSKYGAAHNEPVGTIWVYLVEFVAPWILYVFYKMWDQRKTLLKDPYVLFLLLWLFWSPLFFATAKNILHTYILTSTIPCALLVSHWMSFETAKTWIKATVLVPVLLFVGLILYIACPHIVKPYINTDKFMVAHYNEYKKENPENTLPVLYWKFRSFSSCYYTQGKSEQVDTLPEFLKFYNQKKTFFIILPSEEEEPHMTDELNPYKSHFELVDNNYKRSIYKVNPE